MRALFQPSHIAAGFSAVLVGYTASVVIVIQAATAAGASPEILESWLLTLGLLMGVTSIGFSWFYRRPIFTAWSTPGAAMLIAAAGNYPLPVLTGSFIACGLFIVITGLVKPLTKALERIPPQLGTAMLGAILLPFCVKAFQPVTSVPQFFLPMLIGFLLVKQILPRYAMLALLLIAVACALFSGSFTAESFTFAIATPQWVTPQLSISSIINITLPLYLITMLSQNLPGITMISTHGYKVPVKSVLVGTGLGNALLAPFGGFSANLAAISAAICLNESVDPDKNQRYRAAVWGGVFYLVAGVFATSVVALFLSLPQSISQMLAGFALLGTLLMCLQNAFSEARSREPALFTFLITLSGVSVLGISSTVWGLLAGLVLLRLRK
ncbi:benzoate/H(+) symporter BenE family transporter [Reinekea marinisedimentorum]|uniref:Benzoate membrane transport protein n=1 Tax=Reinekea marinisedimentorum TaxID=230495 RepID=A0A4R3ICK3_9GAMM|nr:benzoate/H(+) symporter BenE family transporter [Reinekea marinisedimentorum]TCS43296.1 benzoate membrane transport protein [Reinekea marinisedimentorum]